MGDIEGLHKEFAELRKRVAELEAERSVLNRLHLVHHALANQLRDLWLECFADDAVFASFRPDESCAFQLEGHAQLEGWFDAQGGVAPGERHALLNPLVSVEDDTAQAESFFITLQQEGESLVVRASGHYSDRLVRCADGKWRIRERHAETRLGSLPRDALQALQAIEELKAR